MLTFAMDKLVVFNKKGRGVHSASVFGEGDGMRVGFGENMGKEGGGKQDFKVKRKGRKKSN